MFFAAAASSIVFAADFPDKAITMVVPSPPGGVVDASARLVGDALSAMVGKPVVVDNKGGGSGNVAYAQVARAVPDGYTLLASYSGYHVGNPSLSAKLPWKPKDLEAVALVTVATNVIAVNSSLPVSSLEELIRYLKANPGKVSYASQGNGSVSHIGTEIFKQQTGTRMVHIPYRGSGPALQDVISGQVQLFITTPPSVMGQIKVGKLKGLAVTSKERYPGLPELPTTSEAGLGSFELESWVGIFAPAGTPKLIINKLSSDIQKVLERPELKTAARAAGFDLRYEPPEMLEQRVKKETAFWATVIAGAGIKAD